MRLLFVYMFISSVFVKVFRLSYGFFLTPSFSYSRGNCATVKTETFRPFSCTKSFPIIRNQYIVGFVSTIFLCLCPSAIFWKISETVVNSIKLVFFRRPMSYIFYKIPKIKFPTVTDCDSFCSIKFICIMIFIIASDYHSSPYIIEFMRGSIHNNPTFKQINIFLQGVQQCS